MLTTRRITLLLVSIATGFLVTYAYKVTQQQEVQLPPSFEQREAYRQELIEQQERNKALAEELRAVQESVFAYEQQLATEAREYEQNVDEAERLRQLIGLLPAEGQGVRVTLEDGEYDPRSYNPNDYIVHERHIFEVVNELKIAGADAVAINGKRLKANSYIFCNGPVVVVDGEEFPAPFVIEAIGERNTLEEAIRLTGGVLDRLVNDRVVVTVEPVERLMLGVAQVGE